MEPTKNNLTNWKEKYLELYIETKKYIFEYTKIYKGKMYNEIFSIKFIDCLNELNELGITDEYITYYLNINGVSEDNV